MALFLGLDAGSVPAVCAVAEGARELARRSSGSVRLLSQTRPEGIDRLLALIRETIAAAAADPAAIRGCCIGLATGSSASVRGWVTEVLEQELPEATLLVTDEEDTALEAAFAGGPGLMVISGTGSRVIGRCSDGMRIGAGGYGPAIGDEGSGYWIGREGLRAALRARDRGVQSEVLKYVGEQWQLPQLNDLIAFANDRVRPAFSDLVRTIAGCAERGDRIAASVLERAGEELADQVAIVLDKMRAAGCRPSDCQQLAYTGTVLTEIASVRWSMVERLRHTHPDLELQREAADPVTGALWRAREAHLSLDGPISRLRGFRS